MEEELWEKKNMARAHVVIQDIYIYITCRARARAR